MGGGQNPDRHFPQSENECKILPLSTLSIRWVLSSLFYNETPSGGLQYCVLARNSDSGMQLSQTGFLELDWGGYLYVGLLVNIVRTF